MAPDRFPTADRLRALGQQAQARVYRARRRTARRNRLTGRAALLALVVCALVVALAYPTRQYIAQRSQIADQRAQAAAGRAAGRAAARGEGPLAGPRRTCGRRPASSCTTCCPARPASPCRDRSAAGGGAGRSAAAAARPWYANLWDGVDAADAATTDAPGGPSPPGSLENVDMETPPPHTDPAPPTDADTAAVREQLGRPAARDCGPSRTAARAATRTSWRPRPGWRTARRSRRSYYLTCPRAASAIGTLEADGVMKEMTARLAERPGAGRRPTGRRTRTTSRAATPSRCWRASRARAACRTG